MTLELSSETNLLLLVTMPVNSSFPAIKPLPGSKKNFPAVTGRVNSQPMIYRNPNKNSSGVEVGMNWMFPSVEKSQLPKPRTHHDSSAVSACLKSDTGNLKKLEFKSKIPVRKPEMIGNRIESSTKPKWNSTTQVNRSAEIKPLPGIKKTLGDFFRKPFRATPAPATTHNPRLVVMNKDRQEVKKGLPQQSVEKPGNKIIPDSRKPNPFRAIPAPGSTYKPFQPVLPSKIRQSMDKGKITEDLQQGPLIIKPFVQNVATTSTLSFPEEESDESNRIPKEPDVGGLSDPVESMDGQAENSDI
jgi:hypothetical protein